MRVRWILRSSLLALAALVAVLGHMFPIWLGFRGGKGVATSTGVFFAVHPAAMGLAVIVKHHSNIGRLARGEERRFPR